MGYTHFDALSVRNGGLAVGKKGAEVEVISPSGNISAGGMSTQTLTSSATIAVSPTSGFLASLVAGHTATLNFAAGTRAGQRCILKVTTSGTTSYTLTFGTNTKSTGTLATGTTDAKVFVVQFIWDGTNWLEAGRTTAM